MQTKGPYVAVACFCERVLQEQDGVLSAIRIVDRVQFKKADSTAIAKDAVHAIHMLICLKSGDFKGTGEITVRANSPSGKAIKKGETKLRVELKGGEEGYNLIINTGVPLNEGGTYWYDILFENRLLTRIPMSVDVFEPETATSQPVASRSTLSRRK